MIMFKCFQVEEPLQTYFTHSATDYANKYFLGIRSYTIPSIQERVRGFIKKLFDFHFHSYRKVYYTEQGGEKFLRCKCGKFKGV